MASNPSSARGIGQPSSSAGPATPPDMMLPDTESKTNHAEFPVKPKSVSAFVLGATANRASVMPSPGSAAATSATAGPINATQSNIPGAWPAGPMKNHCLQDYQFQLMLLEQQNKVRLMMADRQLHEASNPPKKPDQSPMDTSSTRGTADPALSNHATVKSNPSLSNRCEADGTSFSNPASTTPAQETGIVNASAHEEWCKTNNGAGLINNKPSSVPVQSGSAATVVASNASGEEKGKDKVPQMQPELELSKTKRERSLAAQRAYRARKKREQELSGQLKEDGIAPAGLTSKAPFLAYDSMMGKTILTRKQPSTPETTQKAVGDNKLAADVKKSGYEAVAAENTIGGAMTNDQSSQPKQHFQSSAQGFTMMQLERLRHLQAQQTVTWQRALVQQQFGAHKASAAQQSARHIATAAATSAIHPPLEAPVSLYEQGQYPFDGHYAAYSPHGMFSEGFPIQTPTTVGVDFTPAHLMLGHDCSRMVMDDHANGPSTSDPPPTYPDLELFAATSSASPGSQKRARETTATREKMACAAAENLAEKLDGEAAREKRSRIVPISKDDEYEPINQTAVSAAAERHGEEGTANDIVNPEDAVKGFDFCDDQSDGTLSAVFTPFSAVSMEDANEVAEEEATGNSGQKYAILHRITCSHLGGKGGLYAGEPVCENGHYAGSSTIADFSEYISTMYDKPYFVVIKEYSCGDGLSSTISALSTGQLPEEIIVPVCVALETTLAAVALYDPNSVCSLVLPTPADPAQGPTQSFGVASLHITDLASAMYGPKRARAEIKKPMEKPQSQYNHVFMFHHRQGLKKVLVENPDRQDIDLLLHYFDTHATYADEYHLADNQFASGSFSLKTLKYLFRPNGLVVHTSRENAVFVVEAKSKEDRLRPMELRAWHWTFDGEVCRRGSTVLKLRTIPGTELSDCTFAAIPMAWLGVYPVEFMTSEMRSARLKAARTFLSFTRPRPLYSSVDPCWDATHEVRLPAGSRCMIDYRTLKQLHRNSEAFTYSGKPKLAYDPWPLVVSPVADVLSDDLVLLLPRSIYAFFFSQKAWLRIRVEDIKPVTWHADAWDKVVLPQDTKDLLAAVFASCSSFDREQVDPSYKSVSILEGRIPPRRFAGSTVFLHGPPGTGKTLAVEALAEHMHLPLYSFTSATIAHIAKNPDAFYSSAMAMGDRWNTVLAFEEFDLILEAANEDGDEDAEKAMRVVWRLFESYPSLLVLTGQDVSSFGGIFRSRVDMSLRFPMPDTNSLCAILEHMILALPRAADGDSIAAAAVPPISFGPPPSRPEEVLISSADMAKLLDHVDELLNQREGLTGRDVANALKAARRLAMYKGRALQWRDIKLALDVARNFDTDKEEQDDETADYEM